MSCLQRNINRLIDKEKKLLENELKDYEFNEGGIIRKLLRNYRKIYKKIKENEFRDNKINEGGFPVSILYP